jgi:glutamate-1-semialdehyde 2,1-aminomutase
VTEALAGGAPAAWAGRAAARRRSRPRLRTVVQVPVEVGRAVLWSALHAVAYLLARGPDRERRRGAVLQGYLRRMGPLYIKAGQVLATQSGLLTRAETEEFRSFFSDLDPMPERALRRVLRSGLGRPVDEVFARFEWTPVAVGSVAQVHRGVLRDGQVVAVKAVKRGVRERLAASCWVARRLLRVVHAAVPGLRKYQLAEQFAELEPLLTGQCDMLGEAARQREVAVNFLRHPFLRVPAPVDALCSGDVLVMEFLDGVRGQDFERAGVPRPVLASRMQEVFYLMVYFHGRFHVDPHPGNILFGRGGSVQLLDFGLVGTLSEDDRWNLASFYHACTRGEWDLALERFTRAFVLVPGGAPERRRPAYADDILPVLRRHFEEETSRWSTVSFFTEAARVLRRHGARFTTRFSMLALALLTGEGFVAQIDPDIDVWRNARRFTDRFSPYMSGELRERFEREFAARIPRSLEAKRAAARYLVAPTHLDRFVLPSAFPLVVEEAHGSRLRDVDGNEYVDLSCGYGPHILGYAHPVVVEAVRAAVARGAVNALASPGELRLAERIAEPFGGGSKVVLANSGTESAIVAIRMARAFTRRPRVAKFEGHYHGFSDQGLVSSWFRYRGDPQRPEPIAGTAGADDRVVEGTLVLQYGERSAFERIAEHADELACVLLEPMPAALAGIDRDFLLELEAVCRRLGVLLVFDEVVTGFRVHYGGAQHLAGVRPDLTCLGKVIGGGLPCGAVVGRPDVVDVARTSADPFLDVDARAFVGGTMSGNSVTCAAGLAVLEHLREHPEVYAELRRKTAWLTGALRAAAAEHGVPCIVTGSHSIFSLTFAHAQPRLVRDRLAGTNMKANMALAYYMRTAGVYMPELHTMMLSDAHTDADLECVAGAFRRSLREMVREGFFTT